jgi:type II secretory pathway pseudopilin PulG
MIPMRRHRRIGFTLNELLVALGLLAVFAIAATRLFQATMRVGRSAADAADAAASLDTASTALRADAWAAEEINVPNPTTAKLGPATWTIRGERLTRAAGNEPPRHWPAPPGVTFAADPPAVLVLRLPGSDPSKDGELRLVSQKQLLARLAP